MSVRNTLFYLDELENRLRAEETCHGCGKSKEGGLMICWECFKYVPPIPGLAPLKHYPGDLAQWVGEIDKYRAKRGRVLTRKLKDVPHGVMFRFTEDGRPWESRGNGWYGSQEGYDGGPWCEPEAFVLVMG